MHVVAPDQRAGALRAADLVRRRCVRRSAPSALISQAMRPGALHRVDMQQAARRMHDVGNLRDRLDNAGLVVGEHHRNQRPLGSRNARRERMQIDDPVAS